jgi:hypothetical protein
MASRGLFLLSTFFCCLIHSSLQHTISGSPMPRPTRGNWLQASVRQGEQGMSIPWKNKAFTRLARLADQTPGPDLLVTPIHRLSLRSLHPNRVEDQAFWIMVRTRLLFLHKDEETSGCFVDLPLELVLR